MHNKRCSSWCRCGMRLLPAGILQGHTLVRTGARLLTSNKAVAVTVTTCNRGPVVSADGHTGHQDNGSGDAAPPRRPGVAPGRVDAGQRLHSPGAWSPPGRLGARQVRRWSPLRHRHQMLAERGGRKQEERHWGRRRGRRLPAGQRLRHGASERSPLHPGGVGGGGTRHRRCLTSDNGHGVCTWSTVWERFACQ